MYSLEIGCQIEATISAAFLYSEDDNVGIHLTNYIASHLATHRHRNLKYHVKIIMPVLLIVVMFSVFSA
jgi:hypothetical protein